MLRRSGANGSGFMRVDGEGVRVAAQAANDGDEQGQVAEERQHDTGQHAGADTEVLDC